MTPDASTTEGTIDAVLSMVTVSPESMVRTGLRVARK